MIPRTARVLPVAVLAAVFLAHGAARSYAQEAVDQGRAVPSEVSLKMWIPTGSVRLVGWDRDSLHVRGTVPEGDRFFFGGAGGSFKLDISASLPDSLPGPARLEVFVPRGAQVSLKTVTASITGEDVTGWFFTVSGAVELTGEVRRLEVETLDGPLTLRVEADWVRARTGDGALTVEGRIEDMRASSVSGPILVRNKEAARALFETVTGDIRYVGSFSRNGTMEFDSHSGTITLVLPERTEGRFSLKSVAGTIDNGFSADRPGATAGGGRELDFSRGAGDARIVVRTYKGAIRLLPM